MSTVSALGSDKDWAVEYFLFYLLDSQAGHDRALELLFACVTFQLLDSQSRVRKQSMEVFDDLDVIINERSLPNLATSATNLNSNHWIEVRRFIFHKILLINCYI